MQETVDKVELWCRAQSMEIWKYIEREPQDFQRQLLKNVFWFFPSNFLSPLFSLPRSHAFPLPFPALLSCSAMSFCFVSVPLGLAKAVFVILVLEFSTEAETCGFPRRWEEMIDKGSDLNNPITKSYWFYQPTKVKIHVGYLNILYWWCLIQI